MEEMEDPIPIEETVFRALVEILTVSAVRKILEEAHDGLMDSGLGIICEFEDNGVVVAIPNLREVNFRIGSLGPYSMTIERATVLLSTIEQAGRIS